MKKMLSVLVPAVLLASPAFAGEGDILKTSLADATRQEMSVAPWVGITVAEVVRGDKLAWVADTGGGQRYACTAPVNAEVVSAAEISCARLGVVAGKLTHKAAPLYAMSQRARIPFPGQADTTSDYMFPAARSADR